MLGRTKATSQIYKYTRKKGRKKETNKQTKQTQPVTPDLGHSKSDLIYIINMNIWNANYD